MDSALTVDDLAQEIRRVDGNHSLGAGALAEALMPFFNAYGDAKAEHARSSAMEEAATACDRLTTALDYGGKEYRREANASECAATIRNLRTVAAAPPQGEQT